MLTYILFVVGFVLLIKGADLLVDGASSVAKKFNVSDLVIGLTVVAFGTSTPELFVNVIASVQGNTEIAIGNILGSNIANILLILGVAAIIYPLTIQRTTTWKEIPFSLLAALALGVLANDAILDKKSFSEISRSDGIILLCFFLIFLYYVFEIARKSSSSSDDDNIKEMSNLKSTIYIIIGLTGLALGGNWIVNGAISLANLFNVSQTLIGLTIVAIGTSLPELATSAVAAYKKNTEIAIGNAVGSNIFNIFWVLGLTSIIRPLPFKPSNNFDILVTILASVLLFGFLFIGKKQILVKWKGIVFLSVYAIYLAVLIIRG